MSTTCLHGIKDFCPFSRAYISNQAANPFTPSGSTSEHYRQGSLMAHATSQCPTPNSTRNLILRFRVPAPASGFQLRLRVPASGFQGPASGLGFGDQSSQFHSRQGKAPHLEDLLLRHAYDRLIPAITINKMKLHAQCSTSTTLLLGSGHDLQLISRVPPCSLKHIDTSCSLQYIDGSTIYSGHAPPRTDGPYHLQRYVLPELRSPKATCSQSYVLPRPRAHKATCSQGYMPIRPCAH
ncbi:hypothetical protein YC2023_117608 [Brassica napus]